MWRVVIQFYESLAWNNLNFRGNKETQSSIRPWNSIEEVRIFTLWTRDNRAICRHDFVRFANMLKIEMSTSHVYSTSIDICMSFDLMIDSCIVKTCLEMHLLFLFLRSALLNAHICERKWTKHKEIIQVSFINLLNHFSDLPSYESKKLWRTITFSTQCD